MSDASAPLANQRYETFSQARAKGLSQAASYEKTVPVDQAFKSGNTGLRVSGHRIEKRPEVRARIDWLRQKHRTASEDTDKPLTRTELVSASLEVAEALEAAYRAARSSTASPQAIERLKTVWAAHLSRQGKMDEATEATIGGDDAGIEGIVRNIGNVSHCSCEGKVE